MKSIIDRSTQLKLRLQADANDTQHEENLARARPVKVELEEFLAHLIRVRNYRDVVKPKASIITKKDRTKENINRFKAGLNQHGFAAFQHQTMANLTQSIKATDLATNSWVKTNWRVFFERGESSFQRIDDQDIFGSTSYKAQKLKSNLTFAQKSDPLTAFDTIKERLGIPDLDSAEQIIGDLIAELDSLIKQGDQERGELSPEIQSLLERARETGVPLQELTAEMLGALHEAQVVTDLVIRIRGDA